MPADYALNDIINFALLPDGTGCAGQPEAAHFSLIRKAGFEVVINLVPGDNPDALPDEAQHVRAAGLEYVHLPVLWDQPTLQNLDSFFVLLERLRGRRVFVHCVLNFRVSAFFFLYQALVEGISQAEARKLMDSIWDPRDYPAWDALIQEALARGPFSAPSRAENPE